MTEHAASFAELESHLQTYVNVDATHAGGKNVLHIEIDVDQHVKYKPIRELTRMLNVARAYLKETPTAERKPVVLIRFGWDRYTVDGKNTTTSPEERNITLIKYLTKVETEIEFTKPLTIV
jgi:hypothetical protein